MMKMREPKGDLSAFSSPVSLPTSLGLMAGAVVIAGLYYGRDALIPLALAVLLSFILTPIVLAFRKAGVKSAFSVPVVMVSLLIAFASIGYAVLGQFVDLADNFPTYQVNLRDKVRTVKTLFSGDTLKRATEAIESIEDEIEGNGEPVDARETGQFKPAPINQSGTSSQSQKDPIEVQVKVDAPGGLDQLRSYLNPFVAPLATLAVTLLFATFILLQREDLRDRIIRLFGTGDLTRTTNAMNDAATRLGRYFFVQAVLNIGYGVIMGLALSLLGVPNAVLWGFVAGLMRFVPYVGTIIALAGPVLLSAATDAGWTLTLTTLVLFLSGEFLMGQIIEPFVYGKNTGLSPLAVIACATFWTLLWGPIGLVLAVPLTLTIVTFGQHIDKLEFIAVLLGNEPALTDEQKFYQRLLSGDHTELALQADELFSEGESLVSYMDRVVLPGLERAQSDFRAGRLERSEIAELCTTMDEFVTLIDELSSIEKGSAERTNKDENKHPAAPKQSKSILPAALPNDGELRDAPGAELQVPDQWTRDQSIVIVAGFDPLDAVSARLLSFVLSRKGFGVFVVERARSLTLNELAEHEDDNLCKLLIVATLGNVHQNSGRLLLRKVRARRMVNSLLLYAWGGENSAPDANRSSEKKAMPVATSLADCLKRIETDFIDPPVVSNQPDAKTPVDAKGLAPAQNTAG